jgi:hypothetical protein
MTPQPLSYATPQPRPRELTLEERSDGFTLTFPARSRRAVLVVSIVSLIGWATVTTVVVIAFALAHHEGVSGSALLKWSAMLLALWGGLMWGVLRDLKFGHVSPVLSIEGDRLIWTYAGFWGIRTREWPLEQVKEIRLKPVKPLFGSKTFADLIIRFHNRRLPFRLRLSTRDPDLPRRVETLLKQAIERHATHAEHRTALSC